MREWLETQPPKVGFAVAARASLRLLPAVMENFEPDTPADAFRKMCLAAFRANLVSAARAMCPADETRQADQLQDAARAATVAAATRHRARSDAASAAGYFGSFAATKADAARACDDLPTVFDAALWPDESGVPELA